MSLYWSVLIPRVPTELSTPWHPTHPGETVLTRGAFKTEAEAIRWAQEHLNGTPYQTRTFEDVDGKEGCSGDCRDCRDCSSAPKLSLLEYWEVLSMIRFIVPAKGILNGETSRNS